MTQQAMQFWGNNYGKIMDFTKNLAKLDENKKFVLGTEEIQEGDYVIKNKDGTFHVEDTREFGINFEIIE